MAAKTKEDKKSTKPYVFATVLASTIMFPRIMLEVLVVNKSIIPQLIVSMASMFVTGILLSFLVWSKKGGKALDVGLRSPFALKSALQFGIFFLFVLVISRIAQQYFGESGIYTVAIISGFADVNAITLSMSNMAGKTISVDTAVVAITIATMTNTAIKFFFVLMLGTRRFARDVGLIFAGIIAAGLASILLF